MNAFDGKMTSSFRVNLEQSPISYNAQISLVDVAAEKALAIVLADNQDSPIEGKTTFNLKMNGKGTTKPVYTKYLNANGDYFFKDGKIKTKNLNNKTKKLLLLENEGIDRRNVAINRF